MATEAQVKTRAVLQPSAPAGQPRVVSPRLLPALLSGGLLWLCYFPVGWGWLAWIALAPLLCLVRAQGRPAFTYLCAWAGGFAFLLPALFWMSVADYRMVYAWIALALYCALYFPAAIWLLRRLDGLTGLPLVLTVPVVWAALEFLRSVLITGFPWYFLGHSQHAYLALIQIVDLTGAYGVTFLVAAVNALIFDRLYAAAWFRRFFRFSDTRPVTGRLSAGIQTAAIVAAIFGVLAYGVARLEHQDFKPGPHIVLLQGNIDQRLRNRAASDLDARLVMGRHYAQLVDLALRERPDLIIWPETSYHDEWIDVIGQPVSEKIKTHQFEILEEVILSKTNHLLGMNSVVRDDRRGKLLRYNTALLVKTPVDFSQRYDKIHRIPFGEYVPLRDWLPFLNNFAPYDYDYSISIGEKYTRFALGEYRFGVLICFEITDAVLARQYPVAGSDGPPVDFLVNISNDGWFDGTSEHEEHLALSRFRAIECRRALVRAVNMGISAVIDGNGRVQEPRLVSFDAPLKTWVIPAPERGPVPDLPESRWHQFKKVPGILVATVPIDERASFYAQWGDWLPALCWLAIALGLTWGMIRRWYWADPVSKTSGYHTATMPELTAHASK